MNKLWINGSKLIKVGGKLQKCETCPCDNIKGTCYFGFFIAKSSYNDEYREQNPLEFLDGYRWGGGPNYDDIFGTGTGVNWNSEGDKQNTNGSYPKLYEFGHTGTPSYTNPDSSISYSIRYINTYAEEAALHPIYPAFTHSGSWVLPDWAPGDIRVHPWQAYKTNWADSSGYPWGNGQTEAWIIMMGPYELDTTIPPCYGPEMVNGAWTGNYVPIQCHLLTTLDGVPDQSIPVAPYRKIDLAKYYVNYPNASPDPVPVLYGPYNGISIRGECLPSSLYGQIWSMVFSNPLNETWDGHPSSYTVEMLQHINEFVKDKWIAG